MITQQAQIIAYIDDYKLLMIATLAVIPLLIVFKRATASDGTWSYAGSGMRTGDRSRGHDVVRYDGNPIDQYSNHTVGRPAQILKQTIRRARWAC